MEEAFPLGCWTKKPPATPADPTGVEVGEGGQP